MSQINIKTNNMFRPLLAAQEFNEKLIKFPCYCTPKIDGIRGVKLDGDYMNSRSMKLIPNKFIQAWTREWLPSYLDGELIVDWHSTFQQNTSFVMSEDIVGDFKYVVFDCDMLSGKSYLERIHRLVDMDSDIPHLKILLPTEINSLPELYEYYDKQIMLGYEGIIIRNNGRYKQGRSTLREGIMIKLKEWERDEGIVINFEEQMHNTSSITNELGYKDKTSKLEDMVGMNTLGSIVLNWNGKTLKVGSGLDDLERKTIWNNREDFMGKIVTFKYTPHGMKDVPRTPIFVGFRSKLDL